jgi:hypothetical protein
MAMAARCCDHHDHPPHNSPAWRQALWGRVSILSQSFAGMLVAQDEKEG